MKLLSLFMCMAIMSGAHAASDYEGDDKEDATRHKKRLQCDAAQAAQRLQQACERSPRRYFKFGSQAMSAAGEGIPPIEIIPHPDRTADSLDDGRLHSWESPKRPIPTLRDH